MPSKLVETQLQLERYKAQAETWEQAFRLVSVKGIPVSEEHIKKVNKRKSVAENYQAGEDYAVKHILANYTEEDYAEIGVQNVWLATAANWLREQVVETIVGALVKVVKENAIKATDWLLSQTEDVILKGYDRLGDEDKSLLKNDLKQYPRFSELLKKIEKLEAE